MCRILLDDGERSGLRGRQGDGGSADVDGKDESGAGGTIENDAC